LAEHEALPGGNPLERRLARLESTPQRGAKRIQRSDGKCRGRR
jgi:hypothetical protein